MVVAPRPLRTCENHSIDPASPVVKPLSGLLPSLFGANVAAMQQIPRNCRIGGDFPRTCGLWTNHPGRVARSGRPHQQRPDAGTSQGRGRSPRPRQRGAANRRRCCSHAAYGDNTLSHWTGPAASTHYHKSLVRLTAQDAGRAGAGSQAMRASSRPRDMPEACFQHDPGLHLRPPFMPQACLRHDVSQIPGARCVALLDRCDGIALRSAPAGSPRPLRSDVPGIYDSGY